MNLRPFVLCRVLGLGIFAALAAPPAGHGALPGGAELGVPAPRATGEGPARKHPAALPRLAPRSCPHTPGALLSAVRARCFDLLVPERRARGEGLALRLFTAVLPARADVPKPDPVLYLQGGPGVPALAALSYWARHPLREQRDIILFDRRGVGLSRPALCPELSAADARVLAADHAPGEELSGRRLAALGCRDSLRDAGLDFGAWNSRASARDLLDLQKLLGIEQWNVVALSYGTRLALSLLRESKGVGLRSVVLDSVYPTWAPSWDTGTSDFAAILDILFESCAQDADCTARFPRLRERFFQTLAALEISPGRTTIRRRPDLPRESFVLNAQDFLFAVHQALYDVKNFSLLPLLIEQVEAQNPALLRRLAEGLAERVTSLSRAAYLAVECYERAPLQSEDRRVQNHIDRPLMHHFHTWFATDHAICEQWSARKASDDETGSVNVDVPTLILSGRYDPVTPSHWGRRVSRTLTDARYYDFPLAHGVMRAHPCPRSLALAFVEAPRGALDPECVAHVEPPVFETRAHVFSGLPERLDALRNRPALRSVVIMSLAGLLLAALLPYRALRRLLHLPAAPAPALPWKNPEHLARLAALSAAAFWLGLACVALYTDARQPLLFAVGLPGAARTLFALPYLALALSAASAVAWWKERERLAPDIGARAAFMSALASLAALLRLALPL